MLLSPLAFWLIIQLFSLTVLPLSWRWLGALPSRGYLLAKPLGLLLVTYVLWLGASLGFLGNSVGGILFSWAIVALSAWYAGRAAWQRDTQGSRPLVAWLRANGRLVAVSELLFLLLLLGWAAVRSYSPEITTAGGEKFMELTFLNGILRSPQFPPLDPWLSGFAISYYYFGYVMLAVLTRLSGLPSSVAFNVGLATWFALTASTAFGVAYDLVAALGRRDTRAAGSAPGQGRPGAARGLDLPPGPGVLAGGLLGALFVAILGNLAGFLESMQGLGLGSLAFWRWLDVKNLNCLADPAFVEPVANCPAASGLLPQRFFWWWRASRVITDRDLAGRAVEVIDEFPFFSFLLGDMHPHVLALPFVLLAVGLALALFLAGSRSGPSALAGGAAQAGRLSRWTAVLTAPFPLGQGGFLLSALCLGALAFLNTWDFPIYLFLFVLALGARRAWEGGAISVSVVGQAALAGVALGAAGVLFYLPFYLGFQSQAGGILPNFIFPTRLSQFFVMFGPLLVAAILLLLALSRDRGATLRGLLRVLPWTMLLPLFFLLLVLIWGVAAPAGQQAVRSLMDLPAVRDQMGEASLGQLAAEVLRLRLSAPWTYLLLATLLAWTAALVGGMVAARDRSGEVETPLPASATAGAAAPDGSHPQATLFALLLLLTALLLAFSVEFVYLRDTFGTRMNTVFKFYYQAWVLLGLEAPLAVIYVARRAGPVLRTSGLVLVSVLVLAGLFYPALATYTRAERFQTEPTLDGTAYLARQNPDDAAAIDWLRANVPGSATILEAAGGSYTYFGRLSAQTGLATLLGWDGHELQWRGNSVEQDRRRPDIERIYRQASPVELQQLLDKWQIDYVIVGPLERSSYGVTPQSEARLARAMDLVFESQGVRIYRRRS